jgi:SpoVK/Ycf46/Vps4 family AAA+-type ATPase
VVVDEVVRVTSGEEAMWDAIIVADQVKERIRNQCLLSLRLRAQLAFRTTALHGLCFLYGPPGTGKTTLARGLPAQIARYVSDGAVRRIEVNPHGLMSAEHGRSQQRVTELLAEHVPALAADGMPTVVVLDEVESMAVARSAASLAANPADVHRATDAVLTALDHNADRHPHLYVVATSNFTSALDKAFLSRSDAAIQVPLPDATARWAIMRSVLLEIGEHYPALRHLAMAPGLRVIAEQADGMDGRRTRKVVMEALANRLDTVMDPGRLTEHDLATAVASSLDPAEPSIEEDRDVAA